MTTNKLDTYVCKITVFSTAIFYNYLLLMNNIEIIVCAHFFTIL